MVVGTLPLTDLTYRRLRGQEAFFCVSLWAQTTNHRTCINSRGRWKFVSPHRLGLDHATLAIIFGAAWKTSVHGSWSGSSSVCLCDLQSSANLCYRVEGLLGTSCVQPMSIFRATELCSPAQNRPETSILRDTRIGSFHLVSMSCGRFVRFLIAVKSWPKHQKLGCRLMMFHQDLHTGLVTLCHLNC